ncbi:benzoate/H(+) symporter BenE family transporter [Pseudarthrobacter cellobiosi]|uniref:benzoate/H(+) symporter BenE family transporter n=1 Tax=Pseudarthrobacter cellobiosi TaxID=2953654 RepID=UPI00208FCB77|nr:MULTISPECIES: benzoate/H(+) symporter BenE family transporter [unclassified Pseudarthrobacter]MCO4273779.1 benzoate/H(+) symporter BenE family transporter [Pseudarthrobacter sp. HLT3-5]
MARALTERQPARLPLRKSFSLSAMTAGFVAVAVSYAGPMLVVMQAAQSAGLSEGHTTSWVWSLAVASGVTCVVLSFLTRQPIVVAWSVPGAALLLTALGNYDYSDALGAYVAAALLALVLGVTGWFGRLLAIVPKPVMAAVLAGVLFPFVLNAVEAVTTSPIVAGGLVVAFLIGRRVVPRYAVLLAMAAGAVLSVLTAQAHVPALTLDLSGPVWTTPTFNPQAIMGIAVPLLIVTMAGQNGPGLAMMGALGYRVNDKLVLGAASFAWLVSAPLGAHGINLAAITAGICAGPEAHPDKDRRYMAGIFCGFFYIIFGLFSSAAVVLFSAVPAAMMAALAGVALLGALQASLVDTISDFKANPIAAEAAVITLVVTASGVAPAGIVSPFWGLLAGSTAYLALRRYGRQA